MNNGDGTTDIQQLAYQSNTQLNRLHSSDLLELDCSYSPEA